MREKPMCDFRPPPSAIVDIRTNECTGKPFNGTLCGIYPKVGQPPGFYYIAATGSFYIYFDGTKLYRDYDQDYVEFVKHKYNLEEIPLDHRAYWCNVYQFLFPPEECNCHHF
jgi:hypothetical protein